MIIDGRIADIAEAGFIDGMMVVPEFVLRELQIVADSTDGSKRQRGRRGLDMLQRMQSNTNIQVQIVPDDFPSIREVDLKLLELAKKWEAKVVTNDFNLNKVAHLHHVEVLNINDLANALKPVVLPGEKMTVLILKEGKEYNQGVGYLDDGTMVVVDHARKLIGKCGGDLGDQRAADRQRQDDLRQDGRERQDRRANQAGPCGDRAIDVDIRTVQTHFACPGSDLFDFADLDHRNNVGVLRNIPLKLIGNGQKGSSKCLDRIAGEPGNRGERRGMARHCSTDADLH